jgi:glutathione S-transferase
MLVELFAASGSPYAWRAQLALELKGIPYVLHILSFAERATQSREFLAMNPRGRVPVLKVGDFVLTESSAILGYLDARWPEPPLYGKTPEDRARVLELFGQIMSYIEPVAPRIYRPIFRGGAAADREGAAAAAVEFHAELAGFEATLQRRPWLAIASMSAADLALYPLVQLLLRAGSRPAAAGYALDLTLDRYPALRAWCGRIEAIPGFARTWPSHWREG